MPVVWNHQRTALPPEALTFLKISVNLLIVGPGISAANFTHATLTPLANAGRHTPSEFELPAAPGAPPLPEAPATGAAPATGPVPAVLPTPPELGAPPAEFPPAVVAPARLPTPAAGELPPVDGVALPPVAAMAPPVVELPPVPGESPSELLHAANEAALSASRHDEIRGERTEARKGMANQWYLA